jgi:SAM-dependent methyltransferase
MRWKAGGRLLDVGCATGDFLAHMAKYGWQVHGVEPSLAASRRARQMHDLDVRTGDLEQARFPDGYFDVVTLWDVLEHLHDPLGSLKEIHRILKSDGVLVIELPNTQSFDAMLFGTYWIGLDIPRHLYVFPPAPLEAMLEETGLQIVSRQCFSGGYGAFLLSLRFWLEDRRYDKLGRLIDRLSRGPLLRLLLFPYIRLGYVLGRGPEMTLFCRKLQTQ